MKHRPLIQSVLAVLGYLALAAMLLLPPLRGPGYVLGNHTADVCSFVWYMAWWPHAIGHGMNPLMARQIWWPMGSNTLWTTSIATPALLLSPVTAIFGPVAAYSVAVLLSPVLLAWSTFELCREWCGRFWPALFGGFVVGFSSYEFRQLLNHLNCSMLFPIPFLAWMVLRRVNNKISHSVYIAASVILWLLLFGISTEFVATAVMLGAAGFAMVWFMYPELRCRLFPAAREAAIALGITALAVLAMAGPSLLTGYTGGKLWSAGVYSVDPMNLIVPTYTTWLGSTWLSPLWHLFAGQRSDAEQGAYLGLPLVAMVAVAWWRTRSQPGQNWLSVMLIFTLLLALGPQLHTLNQKLPAALPWLFISRLPVIQKALPGRLMFYAVVLLSLLVTKWLASEKTPLRWRMGAAMAAIIFLLPNTGGGYWKAHFHTPRIFAHVAFLPQAVHQNGVLIFPFGYRGWSMLWQAESHFAFPMVDGYTGTVPGKYAKSPLVQTWLSHGPLCGHYARRLHRFLRQQHIATVIAIKPFSARTRQLIAPLGHPDLTVGRAEIFGPKPSWMHAASSK